MRLFFILIFLSFLTVITTARARAAFSPGLFNAIHNAHSTTLAKKEASLSYWFTSGYFEMEGGPPAAENRWIINHPTGGKAVLLEARFRPAARARLSYDMTMGIGIIEDGRMTDTDIDALGVVSDLSYSTSSGRWAIFGANAYIRAFSTRAASIDLSIGYLYLRSSADYNDPKIKIDNYISSNASWQEQWLTYDLTHHGIKFGLRGEAELGKSFSVKAALGVIPWLQAEYDGLRYPERPLAQQQIEAIEAEGLGLDALISAEYAPYKRLLLTLGYKFLSFKTKGRDRAGTPWAGSWEELSMELKGPFVALGFSF